MQNKNTIRLSVDQGHSWKSFKASQRHRAIKRGLEVALYVCTIGVMLYIATLVIVALG